MSDIKICRQTLNKFKTNQTFSGDKAYIGETQITTPHKKPKKGKLTENQIEENKALSSNRIFVEHLIRESQFIILPKAEDVIDVVIGKPGPMSDIKICRQTLNKFKTNQTFSGDKAYIGETQITTPHKKPKKGKLTENQIEENKALSSNRIFVEHLIRVVKVFFVVKERFRLHKN